MLVGFASRFCADGVTLRVMAMKAPMMAAAICIQSMSLVKIYIPAVFPAFIFIEARGPFVALYRAPSTKARRFLDRY